MSVSLERMSAPYLPFVRIHMAHMIVPVLTVQGWTAKETVHVQV